MYDKFNELIDEYDNDDFEKTQLWYESEYKYCDKLISNFNEKEWKMLDESMPLRSNVSKERIVYCLIYPDNKYCRKIILDLIDTNNSELFVQVVYTLLSTEYDFPLEVIEKVVDKINIVLPKVSSHERNICNLYLKKIYKLLQELRKVECSKKDKNR